MRGLAKKVQEEAEYWDKKNLDGIIPDIRRQKAEKEVNFIWDDPEIEEILRHRERSFIIDKASKNNGGRVLEIGCGVGWLSLELARQGMNVTGIDLSNRKISVAREYYEKVKKEEDIGGSIEYIADSIHNMNFEPSTFDAIVAWDALHHIPNMPSLIRKIKIWLKTDGQLLVCDFMGSNLFNMLAMAIIYMLPVIDKLKLLRKIKNKIMRKEGFAKAPLEGVSRWEIVREIRNNFQDCEYRTTLAFCYYVAPFLFLHNESSYDCIEFFRRLDDALVKLHLLRGEYIFVWAKNGI